MQEFFFKVAPFLSQFFLQFHLIQKKTRKGSFVGNKAKGRISKRVFQESAFPFALLPTHSIIIFWADTSKIWSKCLKCTIILLKTMRGSFSERSLLNYVPYVLSCPTCLVPYVPSCLTCLVPYVLSCPTCLVPYVLRALRALVPHVPHALRALVPHMSCALRALVPYVPLVLHALVPNVSRALRVSCLM